MSRALATVWAVVVLLIAGLVMAQIPTSVSGGGGGGGGGATSASQLTDAKWTRTSATVETLTFPTGGTTFSSNAFRSIVTNGCTITLAAGGAAAGTKFYTYWDPSSNTLKVDVSSANFNNVTVGAGCTASSTGATGYPQDVVPLGTLAAGDNTVDQWNTSPLTDTRAVYNVSPYKVGSFLTRTYAPSTGVQTLALDTTTLSNPSGTKLMTGSGAFTNGDVAKFNASGDIVDGGASAGTTCDPFVLSNQCFMGDFSDFSTGTPANQVGLQAGTVPMFYILSGGTVANLANALGSGTSPTGIQVTSNGGANNYIGAMIGLQQGGSVQKFLPTNFLTTAATFDFKFNLSLNTFAGVAGDNEKFFIGCTDGFPTNTNAFGVEYVSGTDTQWTAVSINGGTATRTNIAAGDTNRHNLEVKKTSTANSVQMCVDATCATAITANIPTVALNCGIALQGTTITSVTANLYKFFLMLTGMTNP